MKRLIKIVIATSSLSLPFTTYASPQSLAAIQVGGRTVVSAVQSDDNGLLRRLRNAVSHHTVVIDGKSYPKNAYSESTCCVPGEKKTLTGIAPINIRVPQHSSKNVIAGPTTASWTANTCWIIDHANPRVKSKGGSSDYLGLHYKYNQLIILNEHYADIFSKLKEYLATFNMPSIIEAVLKTKLEEYINHYKELSYELSSSHDTVFHAGTVYGQGVFYGPSWLDMDLTVFLTCKPPELTSPEEVLITLKIWIDTVVSSIGVSYDGPSPTASAR